MITRRRFISISMMIVALFLLFQGPQIIRERWNQYGINSHAQKTVMTIDREWNENETAAGTALYVGEESSDSYEIVKEWAHYTKRRLIRKDNVSDVLQYQNMNPDLVIIDESLWADNVLERDVEQVLKSGMSVLFTKLPSVERISQSHLAQELLGITSIYEPSVTTDGVHLFSGFFLGGERIYQPLNEKEESLQDLELTMPWYRLGQRTETYMMGIIDDENYLNESMPGIIWSCANGDAKAFAIVGDYFQDRMIGIGILNAAVAKIQDSYLYPCVNSQQFEILNYPALSNENNEELQRIYSRNTTGILRNLILPGITADTAANKFIVSAYIMPQYDYADDNEPISGELNYYLRKIGEDNGEACYSMDHNDTINLDGKLKRDIEALHEAPDYEFTSAFVDFKELEEAEAALNLYLPGIRTLSTRYSPNYPLISFLTSGRTLQTATADVTEYSYTKDLEQMGAETALGYANIQMDMKKVYWPSSEEDQWQNASRNYFSVIDTYWKPYSAFEHTTASLADQRARNLLTLSYEVMENDDELTVLCNGFSESAEFILRTHNKKVTEVDGGSFQNIEEDAWLISIQSTTAHIKLEEDMHLGR